MGSSSRVMRYGWDRHAVISLMKHEEMSFKPEEIDALKRVWEKFETHFEDYSDAVIYALYFFHRGLMHFDAWTAIDKTITLKDMLSLSIMLAVEETNDDNSISFLKRFFDESDNIRDKNKRNRLRQGFFQVCRWRVIPNYFTIKTFIKFIYALLADPIIDNEDNISKNQLGFLVDMFDYKLSASNARHPIWDMLGALNPPVVRELNHVYDELNQQGLVPLSQVDSDVFKLVFDFAMACVEGTDKRRNFAEDFSKAVINYLFYHFVDDLSNVSSDEKETFYHYIKKHYRVLIECVNKTDYPYLQNESLREFLWGLILREPSRLSRLLVYFKRLNESRLLLIFRADIALSIFVREVVHQNLKNAEHSDIEAVTRTAIVYYSLHRPINNSALFFLKEIISAKDYRRIADYQIRMILSKVTDYLCYLPQEVDAIMREISREDIHPSHVHLGLMYLINYMKQIEMKQVDCLLNNRLVLCAYAGIIAFYELKDLKRSLPTSFIASVVLLHQYSGDFFNQDVHGKREFCRIITLQILSRRLHEDRILQFTARMKPKLESLNIVKQDVAKFKFQAPLTFFKPVIQQEVVKKSTSPIIHLSSA